MTADKIGDLMLLGRTLAAVDMLGRCGATEVEFAYDDDTGYERVPVVWWATGKWGGQRVDSELFPYTPQALEDLLSRTMNGGQCKNCGRTVVVGVITEGPNLCNYTLTAADLWDPASYRYRRTCEVEEPGNVAAGNRAQRRRQARGRN